MTNSTLYTEQRQDMVQRHVRREGVRDSRVLSAMERVPRHLFVPPEYAEDAYERDPISIGHGQTISAPYIVGFMTEHLRVEPHHRVLEIGTGCGYQTAILAELADQVFTVEYVDTLAESARSRLESMGHTTIHFRTGNGAYGWREAAPFDRIMVTASAKKLPKALGEQLAENGRMIIPIGKSRQKLFLYKKTKGRLCRTPLLNVIFVPFVGIEG
mgnify:CR=1 FL=1